METENIISKVNIKLPNASDTTLRYDWLKNNSSKQVNNPLPILI